MSGASLKFESQSFGLVLRAGRERRKVTLAQLCAETKVRPEVWRALEENDFSRWPKGIFARSLIRQYAERVDLDPEELVNEFCRLFPNGDRRSDFLVREFSAIVGHRRDRQQELEPASPRRRTGDPALAPPSWPDFLRSRASLMASAAVDVVAVMLLARVAATASGLGWLVMLGLAAPAFHAAWMITAGRTMGSVVVEWTRTRMTQERPRYVGPGWAPARRAENRD